jgi:hypothetical protein
MIDRIFSQKPLTENRALVFGRLSAPSFGKISAPFALFFFRRRRPNHFAFFSGSGTPPRPFDFGGFPVGRIAISKFLGTTWIWLPISPNHPYSKKLFTIILEIGR